ncbi:parvalbumin alpha-like [Hyla sarda]|uniref:parvalbumin alpha-like n=1 Tax=Hyla sarda TaxID=327740 RepID=UPI0024C23C78|nr:parvalbumin alpha-like [Hyla sarda]XP_056380080.1 parvalbumin alpha-like [Hyla sarda]
MSMKHLLTDDDITKFVRAFSAPDSFNPKKFFQLCGLKSKSKGDMEKVFKILDQNVSGYIEEDELPFLLMHFSHKARALSAKETKHMLSTCDKDKDGKISMDDFVTMVAES